MPVGRYSEVEQAIKAPTNIYKDILSNELIYIYTHPYEKGKLIKVVIHTNYKYKGVTFNAAKSWGIIHEKDIELEQYKKIK